MDDASEIEKDIRRWLLGRRVREAHVDGTHARLWFEGADSPRLHLANFDGAVEGLAGETITGAEISDNGALTLTTPRATIRVSPNPEFESWDLWADGMTRLVCVPGGEVVRFIPVGRLERLIDRIWGLLQRG